MYWLTVVATVFLPLMFVTGFFGMNFGWMVRRIDTPLAFVLLGRGRLRRGRDDAHRAAGACSRRP